MNFYTYKLKIIIIYHIFFIKSNRLSDAREQESSEPEEIYVKKTHEEKISRSN